MCKLLHRAFLQSIYICVYHHQNKRKKAEKLDHSFISWLHLTGNGWAYGKDQGKCGPQNILKNITIRDMKDTIPYIFWELKWEEKELASGTWYPECFWNRPDTTNKRIHAVDCSSKTSLQSEQLYVIMFIVGPSEGFLPTKITHSWLHDYKFQNYRLSFSHSYIELRSISCSSLEARHCMVVYTCSESQEANRFPLFSRV